MAPLMLRTAYSLRNLVQPPKQRAAIDDGQIAACAQRGSVFSESLSPLAVL